MASLKNSFTLLILSVVLLTRLSYAQDSDAGKTVSYNVRQTLFNLFPSLKKGTSVTKDLSTTEENDAFVPFVARETEPSPTVEPIGFCKFPLYSKRFVKRPISKNFRKVFRFKNDVVRFKVQYTLTDETLTFKLRAKNPRRIDKIQVNFFLPGINLKKKNQLGPIINYNYADAEVTVFEKTFDLSDYLIPQGKKNCCNTKGNIGIFIKTCNPGKKDTAQCGFKLLSLPVKIKCFRRRY